MYTNQLYRLRKKFLKMYESGDLTKTIDIGEQILKIYEKDSGTQTIFYADDAFNLACVYSKEGRILKATSLYKQSAKIVKEQLGKTIEYSDIINNLAIDLNILGNHKESFEYFKDVYEIRKKLLEPDDPKLIDSISNLGSAYYDIDDYDNAVKYHKIALNSRTTKDLDYADNLNLIGYDLEEKEEYENATEYFVSALDIIKKETGAMSEEYLKNLYYIGFIYEKCKNFVEAKTCYEKSVELIKKHIGEEHPYYAEALNKLANSYMHCGNENKALTLRIKALNIIKNIVGENHLYYASNLKNIADIYFKKGDYKRAKQKYLESLEIKKRLLGVNSEEVIRDTSILCKVYINEGNYELAETTLKECLENVINNRDLHLAILLDLAYIYIRTCDTSKLYEIYEEFAEVEPTLSFDEMLKDIQSFQDNIEKYIAEDDDFNFKNLGDLDGLEDIDGLED